MGEITIRQPPGHPIALSRGALAGQGHAAGAHQFFDLQVEAVAEIYLEEGSLSANLTRALELLCFGTFSLIPRPCRAILRFNVKKQILTTPGVAAAFSHGFRQPAALVRAGLKCNGSVVDIAWLLCLRRVVSQRAEP